MAKNRSNSYLNVHKNREYEYEIQQKWQNVNNEMNQCSISNKHVLNHYLKSQNVFLHHSISRQIFYTSLYQIADTPQVPFASALDQNLLCTL